MNDKREMLVSRANGSIIDRRPAGKNKSIGNRERFLRRHKEQIREAVKRVIDGKSIKDFDKGEEVHIPRRDISQPIFGHGQGGLRRQVHTGNRDYVKGDRIERPKGGSGSGGGGKASDSGEDNDDFVFPLTKEEMLKYLFDDLALPNLERMILAETIEYKSVRAGFTTKGSQNNLSVIRSMRGAIGRRIIFHKADKLKLVELLIELDLLESECNLQRVGYDEAHDVLTTEIDALEIKIGNNPVKEATHSIAERTKVIEGRLQAIPYLDPIDLKFRSRVRVPVPMSKAVMFCIMDISGSMDEDRKMLSKRFFILLYLFLTKHYEKIDIVFIRHHTNASEVDEQNFFHATETGGTVVSSALVLMEQIVKARYPTSEWNIYGAQASDGDNWHHDSGRCRELLTDKILPLCRYYAYVQVAPEEQNLWTEYSQIKMRHFAMRKVTEAAQIYPVFRDLFKKETTT